MNIAAAVDFSPATDRADISCLIDTHSTMLYRFCRSLTYCKEDAEDLFQEVWISVLQKPEKLQFRENPQNFLCAKTLYLWKSQQRKYARRKRIAPEIPVDFAMDSGQNLEEAFLRQSDTEFVRRLVGELSDRHRIPLILFYNLELDISEIAKILNLPQGTVKSRLFAARQEIKKGWLKHENA